ncbi:NADPH-dependent FMN reductase [Putridiphycobacter roseus]|uniref:NADPH-dependent FMN reductase n=1 Tax=Putridiphycobacter roseus TaxID=2219161 RepID=A0A2W1N2A7_9FLAO|nr:NAD(P)H-dependent oxidoreductase [Putridiphycobacter roseus]PZE18779.1 NADPH-dependent FMN reductase [Putridiphycobacter roseus]
MKKIITIGASTSKNSINKTFAKYVASLINEIEIIQIDISNFNDVPIFSVDYEKENKTPEEIELLNSLFKDVDGFIISHAEHNGSFAAGYKNIIDWISRQEGKIFNDKPMLLLSTSPGARGGASVLNQAISLYPHWGAKLTGQMSLPTFQQNFENDELTNPTLKTQLLKEISNFEAALKTD